MPHHDFCVDVDLDCLPEVCLSGFPTEKLLLPPSTLCSLEEQSVYPVPEDWGVLHPWSTVLRKA